ncbi:alpha/beta fold hydrolase [Conexibacter arvalis]|uniref:Pimeloyl-ACP methyl ester carboxylesterase n=1 Tax=Conexibacter arvalis TaxID=912552 RepID=A0A840IIC5_9ACTN|nr:alpha/beta hydrolase [Conexibacter arvalis]MBB4663913.1 pimeloyl-ACP methyl ester carboxylesterase [Conexibacter arvalis]
MGDVRRRRFRTAHGTNLSYLHAGDPARPTVLLLHGFPNSARGFHGVIPALADHAEVVVPDLPGFGDSDPLPATSFAAFAGVIADLLEHLAVGPRYIYLHDFGAPVGLTIAMEQPDQVLGLIVQNANAHRTGFGPQWGDTLAFWADPNPRNEAAATAHLTLDGIRDQYVAGVPSDVAARISPDAWEEDWRVMSLPGRRDAQRNLVADYARHVDRFDAIGDYLAAAQPPALMLWGRHDAFFDIAETLSWMHDLPRMEAHVFDAGHLLLETHAPQAAALMRDFVTATAPARGRAAR